MAEYVTMGKKTASPVRQEREHRVAVLLFDRPSMFETSVAIEVWGNDRTEQGVPYSEVRLCSNEGPRLRVDVGFDLVLDHDLAALEWADTIVLPNGGRPSPTIEYDPMVLDALRAAHAARGPADLVLFRRVPAGGDRPARRPSGHDALDVHEPVPRAASLDRPAARRAVHRR